MPGEQEGTGLVLKSLPDPPGCWAAALRICEIFLGTNWGFDKEPSRPTLTVLRAFVSVDIAPTAPANSEFLGSSPAPGGDACLAERSLQRAGSDGQCAGESAGFPRAQPQGLFFSSGCGCRS